MIVVDTSVLIAILKNEADGQALIEVLRNAERAIIGTPTLFEYLMVAVGRLGQEREAAARSLLEQLGIEVVTWTRQHADYAAAAFFRFGKGRHAAGLNFGDCMAYALAKSLDAPLLFKGDDFARTDVIRA